MQQCCGVDVRNWEAFLISFDLGSVAHGTWRSFDRVLIVCERQISNLSQFDERHACKQVYHSSLDMPCNFNVVYGISRCQRAWVCVTLRRSPPLQTQTQVLWCGAPGPSHHPWGEAEQQGARERYRPGEHNADQREAHLQVPSAMLWSGIKLLISLTHPLTQSGPSVTHPFIRSVTHSHARSASHLLNRSFTYSLCNNTNKQFNEAISKCSCLYKTKKRKETALCLQQVLHLIFCWCGAACWSWSSWASPISQVSALQSRPAG